jgi:hypothetical protein
MRRLGRFPRILGPLLGLLLTLTPGAAFAQDDSPQSVRSPKPPPPPLFPRHRRGLYRDRQGLELVDATPQSPPLETDDPGVPDNGEYEINLFSRADLSKDAQSIDVLFVDANYGVQPSIGGHKLPTQLKFEFPVAADRQNGGSFTLGVGAAAFGLKVNFYNNEYTGLSVSFYPQVEFEAPATRSVAKGLAEPGQTVMLPLLVAKQFKFFTFVANGGINRVVHDPEREGTGTWSVGVGRAFTRKVAAMVELRDESSLDLKKNHLLFLNAGMIHGVRRVIVYTLVGHSLSSDDGVGHTYLGIGMKFMIHTRD